MQEEIERHRNEWAIQEGDVFNSNDMPSLVDLLNIRPWVERWAKDDEDILLVKEHCFDGLNVEDIGKRREHTASWASKHMHVGCTKLTGRCPFPGTTTRLIFSRYTDDLRPKT